MIAAPVTAPDWAHDFAKNIQAEFDALLKARGRIKAYAKANLPSASDSYSSVPRLGYSTLIYVTDEAGGAVPAFTDGVVWRRCTDRNVVS